MADAKRIVFFTDCEWSLGLVHEGLRGCFERAGWDASLLEWAAVYEKLDDEPLYMTLPGSAAGALLSHKIPLSKTYLVAHAESDLIEHQRRRLPSMGLYAGYGVTSDTLACSSITLGIQRVPQVLRLGIDSARYAATPLPDALTRVGYMTIFERKTTHGIEIKRGQLAEQCAREAGLEFVTFPRVSNKIVHELYGKFDAYVLSSLQDASPHPPLEAASAGRLLVGAPVGHYPRLALEGLGTLAPLNDLDFKAFVVAWLKAWKSASTARLQAACVVGRQAAERRRDWSVVGVDWIRFVEGALS